MGKAMSNDDFKYDIFVSYRRIPYIQLWVNKRLVPGLEAAGLRICLDDTAFRLGAPILLEMERAIIESCFTVGVFTPEYTDSGFTELEYVMAKHLAVEERETRFIGLIYRDCTLPLMSRSTLMLDMRDESKFEANIQRLVNAVKKPP